MPANTPSTLNRSQLSAGCLHIGLGAFHRAHQAMYLHRLLTHTDQQHWGIVAVNLRPAESKTFQRLAADPDGYWLRTSDGHGSVQFEQIQSHVDHIDAAHTPEQAISQLADPAIKLVTITVTEAGYYLDAEGALDSRAPELSADINDGGIRTVYGYLAAGLATRARQSPKAAITVLCCDNLRHNGQRLKAGLTAFLRQTQQADLLEWLSAHTSFPCSMVDRITPRTSDTALAEISEATGSQASTGVAAEQFCQWVIEDNFATERPQLERVGVEIVPSVDEHEETKIRLLNAGHTALCYLGTLSGLHYFHDAMHDNALRGFLEDYLTQEAGPALSVTAVDVSQYIQTTLKRFSNAEIADTLARICTDGYSKMPLFIQPTLRARQTQGLDSPLACQAVAAWLLFCQHHHKDPEQYPYLEPYWAQVESWLSQADPIKAVCSASAYWGEELASDAAFYQQVARAHGKLSEQFSPVN